MAEAVARGRYMHLRGNTAVRSLVMADDVARAARITLGMPGVFNVSDGIAHSVISIADAMAANLGTDKRVLAFPARAGKMDAEAVPLQKAKEGVCKAHLIGDLLEQGPDRGHRTQTIRHRRGDGTPSPRISL